MTVHTTHDLERAKIMANKSYYRNKHSTRVLRITEEAIHTFTKLKKP
jgi:hypothetical protein